MTVEVLATKEVPVEIEYMGVPEDGYMATGEVESSVPTVRIAGTVSTLVGISAITVPEDRMNITGQTDNLVDIINLKEYLPKLARVMSQLLAFCKWNSRSHSCASRLVLKPRLRFCFRFPVKSA